ncbi:hypothetical protein DFQ28_006856 [Apophysomyces sp. BC1034]|nr:hypothetical protein DFQ30_006749 [Apophysomyces sp. BC1015]KAG0178333.1 hypothetical protein DFQ29_003620 [Apophysomyces sp. BC1021]KAG0187107.1 hypothetical protein DFQ28_006856 [Apophysomyces sp. BC1034]
MKIYPFFTITAAVASTVSAVGYEGFSDDSTEPYPVTKEQLHQESYTDYKEHDPVADMPYAIPKDPYSGDSWQHPDFKNNYPGDNNPYSVFEQSYPAYDVPYPALNSANPGERSDEKYDQHTHSQPVEGGGVEFQTKPPVVIVETVTNTLPADFPPQLPGTSDEHGQRYGHHYGTKGKGYRKVDIYHKDHSGSYHAHGGSNHPQGGYGYRGGKKHHYQGGGSGGSKYRSQDLKHGQKKNKKKYKQDYKHKGEHGEGHGSKHGSKHGSEHGKHKYGDDKHHDGGSETKEVHADSIDKEAELKTTDPFGDMGAAAVSSKALPASGSGIASHSSPQTSTAVAVKSAAMASGSAGHSASASKITARPAATNPTSGTSSVHVAGWTTVFLAGLAAYCLL